jgi:hypothetical protein
MEMASNLSFRKWAILVFCAYIGFVLAGGAFYGMVDDSPFVPLMNKDISLMLAWLVVAGGAGIALLAIVVGGLPVGLAVVMRAIRTERRNLLLLSVPVISLGVLGATMAVIFVAVSSYENQDVPASVSATASAVFAIVFVLAAVASTAAVCLAVARTDAATGEQVFRAKGITITVEPYTFAFYPASVAALAMAAMLAGTLAWGIIAWSNAPRLFSLSSGYFGMSNGVMWALTVVAMAIATAVAWGAIARWAGAQRYHTLAA